MRYVSWITAPEPLIAAPKRVEVESNSSEHAALLVRAMHPGARFSLPRLVDSGSYRRQWHDSITDRFNRVHV